ncbi:MAG: DUF1109 domain-containing protein [Rhodospirillales bacterium]|nr:DUF1109 domain-containing protein [Rhodospirillales bacterium]
MGENKNIESLIEGLADELKPQKPLPHPLLRVLPFLVIAIIYVSGLVYIVGVRSDIGEKFSDPAYMIEIFLMAFTALSSGIAASYLSVPDMRGAKWVIAPPLTALAIFCVWSIIRASAEGMHMPHIHFDHCMGEGVFISVAPLALLITLIRKGASTHPYLGALMNAMAAAGLGYVGLRFTCSMDTVGHATVSHLIPYVIIGMILALSARKVFKW